MAGKREFLETEHIVARLEAIIAAQGAAQDALENVREVVLPHAPEKVREIMDRQITKALDALTLARRAVTGGLTSTSQ